MSKKAVLLAFLIFLIIACELPAQFELTPTAANTNTNVPPKVVNRLVTANPNATATRTPFLPLAPTFTPSVTPSPTPTFTPVPPTPTRTLPPLPPGTPPDGQVTILVMGSDERPGGGFRTDVMVLVILNPEAGTASLMSFPRDLWVLIPGWGNERLNTAMYHGFDTMASTFETNFGVRPQYYMQTNFDGFKTIIDTIGGIDVKVKKGLHDKCDLPSADRYGYCTIEPATVPMDGEMALWYVRSRYSTSDFDRLRRAQEVLQAIFVRMLDINALRNALKIYKKFSENVDTNISLDAILGMLFIAPKLLKPGRVSRYVLTPNEAYPVIMLGGAQVLQPNYPAIQQMVQQALLP